MEDLMFYKFFIQIIILLASNEVIAGHEASKVLTGAAIGIATGGVCLAVGAPLATAATAGAVAAGGYMAGGETRVGIQVDGNGNHPAVNVTVNHHGQTFANVTAGPNPPEGGPAETEETLRRRIQQEEEARREEVRQAKQREARTRRAKSSFEKWDENTSYEIREVEGREYHVAKSPGNEFWSLGIGRGWQKGQRKAIGYTTFPNQPSNFTFEITEERWYFDIKVIDGRRYNHAWTDTLLDIIIPEGERHEILAEDWYINHYRYQAEKAEAEKAAMREQILRAEIDMINNAEVNYSRGQIEEANWGVINILRDINENRFDVLGNRSETVRSFYERALEGLNRIGVAVEDTLKDMAIPGGIDNLHRFQEGLIGPEEYREEVMREIAEDAVAYSIASIIGGAGGAAGGTIAGGPVGAAIGADLGAAKGAIYGYVASRATRAITRTFINYRNRSGWEHHSNPQTREVKAERKASSKQHADSYIHGLQDRGVLSDKRIAKDGREYFEIQKKCEYNGIKFKKGQFLERDTMHHEWEYFQNKDTHLGAIDPVTGKLNTVKARTDRSLKI